MAIVGLDGKWIRVNSALCKIIGYSEQELLITDFQNITHPDDLAADLNFVRQMLGGEIRSYQMEKRYLHKIGHVVWIVLNVSLILDGSGKPLFFFSQMQDISGRKVAELAQRESDQRIRLLLDSTAEAIYGIDLNGNCTFSNAACARLLGYANPSDLLGKNMHSLIHHTKSDRTPYPVEDCVIYKAFRKSAHCHVDNEVLWRQDGTSFPAEYWSYPLLKDGKPTGAVVTFLDISERKRNEEDLRRFAAIVEGSDDAIIGESLDGTVSSWNAGAKRIYGYSTAEMVGKPLSILSPPDGRGEIAEILE